MKVLPLVFVPDEILRKKANKVEKITPEILNFLDKMVLTMQNAKGIGLAAQQVGSLDRIIIVSEFFKNENSEEDDEKNNVKIYKMINPEIVWHSDEKIEYEEGCLSIPGSSFVIERSKNIKLKYINIDGNEEIMVCDGLFSICVQHEIDHLNGVLFFDYVSKLKRDKAIKKVQKLLKNNEK